ncbi:MAG TPA: winged helix-turn-helix transcriptional regulator [Candidatus Acidoferrales bacterium]|nr:winged helix-turn-helix transcriptional regulator [Candidatus Acidoferrales bacterium]
MRDIEVKLVSELMKNSRRSDRELAKVLKVSQPTVSRTIKKLEKEGIIKEYTMIPDFKLLGYQIMAIMLFGKPEPWREKERAELRKAALEMEKRTPQANLIVVNGEGLKKSRVAINLYRDYASYLESLNMIRNLPNIDADDIESFLIDLNAEDNFRMISMAAAARHLQAFGKGREE